MARLSWSVFVRGTLVPKDIVIAAMLNKTHARSYFKFESLMGKQLGSSPGKIEPAVVEVEKIAE
jgi:hypothetical protein